MKSFLAPMLKTVVFFDAFILNRNICNHNIVNVFTVTFNQFNAPVKKKKKSN